MQKTILAIALLAITTFAQADNSFLDTAQVTGSAPIYNTTQTVTQNPCPGDASQSHGYTGGVLGALVGGLLGHQVGGGSGQAWATGAGAAVGAVTGDRMQNAQTSTPAGDCGSTVTENRQIVGYQVQASYQGHPLMLRTPSQPGATVPIRVMVGPAE
jgi:uncharacterized protein YcfJ